MAPQLKPATRSRSIPRSVMEQAESFLQELPQKEREHLSISEAIGGMAETVRAALAKGYTYNEVSEMLSHKLGISVSAWSLRRYVPAGSRRGKRSKSAQSKLTTERRTKIGGMDALTADRAATSGAVTSGQPISSSSAQPEPESSSPTPKPRRTRTQTSQGVVAATSAKPTSTASKAAKGKANPSSKAKAGGKSSPSRRKKS